MIARKRAVMYQDDTPEGRNRFLQRERSLMSVAKKWIATITYATEAHGELDVDFAYDTHGELDIYLFNGPPMSTVRMITTKPQPEPLLHSDTIEGWIRKLEQVAELLDCETGTKALEERSESSRIGGNHANETPVSGSPDRTPDLDPLLGAE